MRDRGITVAVVVRDSYGKQNLAGEGLSARAKGKRPRALSLAHFCIGCIRD